MTIETPYAGRRWRRWILLGAALAVITAAAWMAIGTWMWGSALAGDQRLLPGTTIAGVAVGDATVDDAHTTVQAALDEILDRVVTVTHDESTWQITPRDAGAEVDIDRALASARDDAAATGFVDHLAFRWLGRASEFTADVAVELDEAQIAAFIATLATQIDHDPIDATIEDAGDGLRATDDATGAQLDTQHAHTAVTAALDGATDAVTLEVATVAPAVTTAQATALLPTITATVDQALDRGITLVHEGRSWTTSPRELGARADVGPAIAHARELLQDDADAAHPDPRRGGHRTLDAPVPLTVGDDAIGALIASIAGDVDRAAVDATMTATATGVTITPGATGMAVARGDAAAQLADAVTGGAADIALPTVTVQPDRTAASYEHVLVLRQSDREVDLYRNGARTHTWPVAVGTGGSPTPVGTFTVGAKRPAPTWVNPSPDGWGADMPARVEPGPDNPLGVRALNWNRPGGGDTLIRFHGTPNEASIGQAASNGCVRMFNTDVVELYDLVSTGTTIISLA